MILYNIDYNTYVVLLFQRAASSPSCPLHENLSRRAATRHGHPEGGAHAFGRTPKKKERDSPTRGEGLSKKPYTDWKAAARLYAVIEEGRM